MSDDVVVGVILTIAGLCLIASVIGIVRWWRRNRIPGGFATRRSAFGDTYREVRRLNLYRYGALLTMITVGGFVAVAQGGIVLWIGVAIVVLSACGWFWWGRAFTTRTAECDQCRYATPCPHRR